MSLKNSRVSSKKPKLLQQKTNFFAAKNQFFNSKKPNFLQQKTKPVAAKNQTFQFLKKLQQKTNGRKSCSKKLCTLRIP